MIRPPPANPGKFSIALDRPGATITDVIVHFDQVPIGATFTYQGKRMTKLALSMAEDEQRIGHIMLYETPVEVPDGGNYPERFRAEYLTAAEMVSRRTGQRR